MKTKKLLKSIVAVTLAASIPLSLGGCGGAKNDKMSNKEYIEEVKSMNIFDNTYEEALPQTIIYKLMKEHFAAPLPEGKTTKKAIIIGYDGYRADGLKNIADNKDSAVMRVKAQGGLYHTFAGGVTDVNEQATSTAPGWSAILSGGWGDYNGVIDNGLYKKGEAKTILTELAEQGKYTTFNAIWREHTRVTYHNDIVYAIEKGLPIEYSILPDDESLLYQMLKQAAKPAGKEKTAAEDPDVMFLIFEHADGAGHGTGFGNQNEDYIEACKTSDKFASEILNTIENRSTYATEDWLIIVTTDHGGKMLNHGGQSAQERSTWLAVNKKLEMSEENLNFAKK